MKRFICVCALALAVTAVSQRQASAWGGAGGGFGFKVNLGFSFGFSVSPLCPSGGAPVCGPMYAAPYYHDYHGGMGYGDVGGYDSVPASDQHEESPPEGPAPTKEARGGYPYYYGSPIQAAGYWGQAPSYWYGR